MKTMVLFFGFALSLNAWAAAPSYDFSSREIYGKYEELDTPSCIDGPCVAGEVKVINGQTVLVLNDFKHRTTFELIETGKGRLSFKWENPEDDDCDDPGCGNLLSVSGVIYPLKRGNKYVPALRVFAKYDYPFPDEDDAPSGEVVHTYNYINRK